MKAGTSSMGTLQIFHEGEWGSVCVDSSDREKPFTEVACREMGFSGFSRLTPAVSRHEGIIWKAKFFCFGNETSIFDCTQLSVGLDKKECYHRNGVTLKCRKSKIL